MVRSAGGGAERVLVVGGIRGLAVAMRRGRRRRGKARQAGADGAPEVPVTRLTVIQPDPLPGQDEAEAWLDELKGSPDLSDELVAEGHAIVNRAMHAHQLATQDPYGGGVPASLALTTRVGYGTGDELVDGQFTDAVEVPPSPVPAGEPRRCAHRSASPRRWAAARRTTPARRCSCGRGPTWTASACGRRPSSCAWASRRFWPR